MSNEYGEHAGVVADSGQQNSSARDCYYDYGNHFHPVDEERDMAALILPGRLF